MGYIVEITSDKGDELKEQARKAYRHVKKLFECIEELCEEDGSMGERGGYGRGGRYGNRMDGDRYGNRGGRMGNRDDEDWDDDDSYMGERRGRSPYTGRYVRR